MTYIYINHVINPITDCWYIGNVLRFFFLNRDTDFFTLNYTSMLRTLYFVTNKRNIIKKTSINAVLMNLSFIDNNIETVDNNTTVLHISSVLWQPRKAGTRLWRDPGKINLSGPLIFLRVRFDFRRKYLSNYRWKL